MLFVEINEKIFFIIRKEVWSMSKSEITRIFECFGLATQEQRRNIISQGEIISFEQPHDIKYKTWLSADTRDEQREITEPKLE